MRNYILITGADPSPDSTYEVLLEGFSDDEVQQFVQSHCDMGEGVEVVVVSGNEISTKRKGDDNAPTV